MAMLNNQRVQKVGLKKIQRPLQVCPDPSTIVVAASDAVHKQHPAQHGRLARTSNHPGTIDKSKKNERHWLCCGKDWCVDGTSCVCLVIFHGLKKPFKHISVVSWLTCCLNARIKSSLPPRCVCSRLVIFIFCRAWPYTSSSGAKEHKPKKQRCVASKRIEKTVEFWLGCHWQQRILHWSNLAKSGIRWPVLLETIHLQCTMHQV